jgi:hypothetical protein
MTHRCPYCGIQSVVASAGSSSHRPPLFALAFSTDAAHARAQVKAWLRKRGPFARSGLARAALTELQGTYVPAYLYSAIATTRYSAKIGETYTVRTGKNTSTRTEWYTLQGKHTCHLSDILVTASRGLSNAELEAIEPFDFRLLRRYDPRIVADWLAEQPSRTALECTDLATQEAQARVARDLRAFLPGDRRGELEHQLELDRESLDLTLVPVWVVSASYREDAPPLRIVVNGQTGKVFGRTPLSWVKIALCVGLVAAVTAGIWFWSQR